MLYNFIYTVNMVDIPIGVYCVYMYIYIILDMSIHFFIRTY